LQCFQFYSELKPSRQSYQLDSGVFNWPNTSCQLQR